MTFEPDNSANEVPLPAVATLAAWLICLTVGSVGLLIPYPRPHAPPRQPPPVEAQLINVQLSDAEPTASVVPPAPPSDATAPPALAAPAPEPALVAPAELVTFAKPVAGPTTLASVAQAAPHAAAPPAHPAPTENGRVVVQLTLGLGEGRQPRPEYPRDAVIAHQEGTVVVEFDIDQNGAVSNVQALSRAPFALLNQVALDTIRDEWRFGPGPLRRGKISIIFKLNER